MSNTNISLSPILLILAFAKQFEVSPSQYSKTKKVVPLNITMIQIKAIQQQYF
jgi:AraC-like DNA-binding protein